MKHWLRELFFAETPFSVGSPLPAPDVEAELAAIVKGPLISMLLPNDLVGSVKYGQLKVNRHRPDIENAFTPVLEASILASAGCTELRGQFRLNMLVRIFMCFWFGGITAFFVATIPSNTISLMDGNMSALLSIAAPICMFLFGILLVKLGASMGESDRIYIQQAVVSAVRGHPI